MMITKFSLVVIKHLRVTVEHQGGDLIDEAQANKLSRA
jgi:hypothetical protein